jgi:hypothetical protein
MLRLIKSLNENTKTEKLPLEYPLKKQVMIYLERFAVLFAVIVVNLILLALIALVKTR